MRWRKLLKQIMLAPIMDVRVRWRRYLVSTAIIFIVLPLMRAMDWYLRGSFIGNVKYMGLLINYAVFASVGLVIDTLLYAILYAVQDVLTARRPLMVIATEHPLAVPIALALQVSLTNFPYSVALAAFLALLVRASFVSIILAYILTFLAGTFITMGLAIVFSIVGLYIRGRDYRNTMRAIHRVLWILIPTTYGISAYPAAVRQAFLYVPTVALVEGIRRFIFGLNGWYLMVYALLSGIVIVFLAYYVYLRAFNAARRSGRIVLQ